MEILGILFFLVLLVVWVGLSAEVGSTARAFGSSEIGWIVLSLLFSPLFGAIMVHCLGKSNNEPAWADSVEEVKKQFSKETEDERIIREADERIAVKRDERVKSTDVK